MYLYFFAVIIPPTFIDVPDALEAIAGKNLKAICKAHGKPLPEITWYKEDELFTGDGDIKVYCKDGSKKFEVESTLQASKAALSDEYPRYVVKAENEAGSVTHEFGVKGIHHPYMHKVADFTL